MLEKDFARRDQKTHLDHERLSTPGVRDVD